MSSQGFDGDEHPVTSLAPFVTTGVFAMCNEGCFGSEKSPADETFVVLAVVVEVGT